jgi:hypothetical protein
MDGLKLRGVFLLTIIFLTSVQSLVGSPLTNQLKARSNDVKGCSQDCPCCGVGKCVAGCRCGCAQKGEKVEMNPFLERGYID